MGSLVANPALKVPIKISSNLSAGACLPARPELRRTIIAQIQRTPARLCHIRLTIMGPRPKRNKGNLSRTVPSNQCRHNQQPLGLNLLPTCRDRPVPKTALTLLVALQIRVSQSLPDSALIAACVSSGTILQTPLTKPRTLPTKRRHRK